MLWKITIIVVVICVLTLFLNKEPEGFIRIKVLGEIIEIDHSVLKSLSVSSLYHVDLATIDYLAPKCHFNLQASQISFTLNYIS